MGCGPTVKCRDQTGKTDKRYAQARDRQSTPAPDESSRPPRICGCRTDRSPCLGPYMTTPAPPPGPRNVPADPRGPRNVPADPPVSVLDVMANTPLSCSRSTMTTGTSRGHDRHPDRAGRASRYRSSKSDLRRPDVARRGTAGYRCWGLLRPGRSRRGRRAGILTAPEVGPASCRSVRVVVPVNQAGFPWEERYGRSGVDRETSALAATACRAQIPRGSSRLTPRRLRRRFRISLRSVFAFHG